MLEIKANCTYIRFSSMIVESQKWRNRMENQIYGYIRVSSKDQNEDRQRLALHEFGVRDGNIFMDKKSGKDFDRPGYKKVMQMLQPGDTLVIKSIDRLGRNYNEILEQWRILTKEKNVEIVVLDMPLLDTLKGRDLTKTLIADIVLQLFSYVAETEREFIRSRQREGIEAAKARGVKFGRKEKQMPEAFDEIYEEWLSGKLSARSAAKKLNVSRQTFQKWTEQAGQKSTRYQPP